MFRKLLALIVAVAACHPPKPAARADVYEGCLYTPFPADRNGCSDGVSTCVATGASNSAIGVCTVECVTDNDCPVVEGRAGTCDHFTDGGRICAVACEQNGAANQCPADTACTEVTRLNGETSAYCLAA